ncbi:aminotransferase class I/II-fold pyridoxal phosphate-dependent enzyme [Legionella shakespearei]|uniref:Aspartate aminotransferase A n=1 Tax=Legionella shakespearei DSM 23087 TaxID=1122169 RepID=A0A0W0YHA6_9GAMM|nr:pyridoxal phosphate-dependent aminotransferase [Legionella shakespearei]KTD56215.1 aspartate aminotransferase A [Legionella shakespearei DSM 23087]
MYTPEGQAADKMDKTMLLNMWVQHLQHHGNHNNLKVIAAGIGKPSLPLNRHIREFLADYWMHHDGSAISYDHPQGNIKARQMMALAMSNWYQTDVSDKNVLFTVGGSGALKAIFSSLQMSNEEPGHFRIVTPFPYYTLYAESTSLLHPVPVMEHSGYRLTAESLKLSIESAYELAQSDGKYPRAFLLCDPNNPLGTVLNKEELEQIAEVLRTFSELYIILDEAYAEMVLDGQHISLLSAAPDLKSRMIVMRSGTKGMSAAGERMAITMAFDPDVMVKLLRYNITNCGHSPISAQLAYAHAMMHFQESDRAAISDFYLPKVEYVHQRIMMMGANLPERNVRPDGTFYVLADLSDLIGEELDSKVHGALGEKHLISGDEEISYSLLFHDFVMISPLSYYGINPAKGLVRITCSESLEELEDLLNRIEKRLSNARIRKNKELHWKLEETLISLAEIGSKVQNSFLNRIPELNHEVSCLVLKLQHQVLGELLSEARNALFEAASVHSSRPNMKILHKNTHMETDDISKSL